MTTNDDSTDLWSPADAAEAYAALGWCVIPIAPGRKHPPVPKWQEAATDDLDIIRSWWGGLYRGHGVGVVTGARSGFWVLDIDVAGGKPGDESLATLIAEHGDLPATVEAVTGSGGGHLLYAWDPARPITNGMATRLPPGLDIRGEGGQIVIAPTVHPSGAPYEWLPGRGPWDIDIAPAPDWLYQLLLTDPESTPAPPGLPLVAPVEREDGPADWLRDRWDWATELQREGWTWHSAHPGESWWTRPGKSTRDGHSAVLHEPDGPLVVFSTEVPAHVMRAGTPTRDGGGMSFSPFQYVTGWRHAGDPRAAGQALRAELRPDLPPRLGPVDIAPLPCPLDPSDPWAGFGVWTPADLATYLAPGWRPEPPTLLMRDDDRGLWYRGNVNWLHGASGEGKTWVALVAVAQELAAGRHVVWVHYEDPLPDKIANRLVLLGIPPATVAALFHVCCVGSASMVDGIPFIRAIAAHYAADLIVVDSIGEAIGSDGVAVKEDERFVSWIHRTCRVLAGDGCTVLGIDHLPMGEPGRLDPVGSFRKKAATTGSMFLAESPNPPTQGKAGYIKLTCAKDRSGVWTKGTVAALIHLAPAGDRLTWSVVAPRAETRDERSAEPESIVLARHAVRAIRKHGPLSQAQLVAAMVEVHGRNEAKRRGIDFAVLQGWLVESSGARGARMFDTGEVEPPTAADLLERWETAR